MGQPQRKQDEHDTITLFTNGLNVINAALEKNKNSTPYAQIIAATEKLAGERKVGVAVYADDPSSPYDYFTIKLHDGRLEMVARGKQEPDLAWKVSRDYLEKITANADDYIDHPAKLDWEWLKSRLGLA